MTEKCIATIIICISSIMMILALRYGNHDKEAGRGVAGWTIVILLFLWT